LKPGKKNKKAEIRFLWLKKIKNFFVIINPEIQIAQPKFEWRMEARKCIFDWRRVKWQLREKNFDNIAS
jgi:hypothetical protein